MLINDRKLYEKLRSIINLIDDDSERKIISEMTKKVKQRIVEHEWETKEVLDVSNVEKGLLSRFLFVVISNFLEKSRFKIKKDLDLGEIIKKTEFPKEIINAKILINRRSNWCNRTPLEEETNQFIKEEIKRIFLEQNKEFFTND